MRATTITIALLAAATLACSNSSKLQDTTMHNGVAGTNGDTARATQNTSGTGTTPGATSADTSRKTSDSTAAKKSSRP